MSKKNNDMAAANRPNTAQQLYDESKTKVSNENDNLDTIREILFGEQTRDAEKRRHDTHHTLQSNITELQKDTKEQFEFLSKEINKLYSLINDESEARLVQRKERNELVNNLQLSLEHANSKHNEENNKLHEQLINEANKLEQQTAKRHAELSKKFEQASLELQSDKTDRGDLAQLLQGMAEQLLNKTK
jgi:hypothetical protein